MGKRLRDNITSQYIEAANRLNSRKARHRIVAYVESYDDIFFWRSVLGQFETADRYFEVMLPSRLEHLERGKKAAIMSMVQGGNMGPGMIACVDADYDYLVQGATATSDFILSNPYVFHSYAYAIENMQCYAPSLHDVCVATTLNDRASFDFERFMKEFSEAIFPLFVWNVWSYRIATEHKFTISDFLKAIDVGNISAENAGHVIDNLRKRVARKVLTLQRQHPGARDTYAMVKADVKRLGVTPATTYMYIQGHHLFDKVVVPLMKRICNQLVRERESEIMRQSMHSTQYRNEMSCYTSSIADCEFMLRRNVGYVASSQYASIINDIRQYLDATETSNTTPENKELTTTNTENKVTNEH